MNRNLTSSVKRLGMRTCAAWKLVLVAVAVALTATTSSFSDSELLVIVNKKHPSSKFDVAELRPLFKVTRTSWASGGKANPVNLPRENEYRRTFDRVVLGMSPDDVAKYWIDRKIRGSGRPPRSLPSSPAVVALVAGDEGAVGYVPAGRTNDRVKVVARIRDGKLLPP